MKKELMLVVVLFTLILQGLINCITAQYSIPEKLEWWYEARFGMFIHFGSYSYLGHGEWAFFTEKWNKTNYQEQVSSNFNPVNYDAGVIARLAKAAGMKYIVITAKHHEGFCMWQTDVESFKDFNGVNFYDLPDYTAFNTRDVLQELKDSCEALGIKFCLYYSILDWNHSSQTVNYSSYFSNMQSMQARTDYIADMKAQLGELVTKYHPAILWFDGDWLYNSGSPSLSSWWTKNDGIDLYNYVTGLDSAIVVNERVCRGFGLGDYECPEREVPDAPRSRAWETCQTMNNSWGYQSSDNNYKTADSIIHELVRVVSRDGNYLLNIGPKGDGTLTNQTGTVLTNMGAWMDIYSESIYGTTRSPFAKEPGWGYYTKKDGKLYAHVFNWPDNHILKVPSVSNTIHKVALLNDPSTLLNYSDSNGYIRISLPESAPSLINSVLVLDVDGVPSASTEFIKVSTITLKGDKGVSSITTIGGTLQIIANVKPTNVTDNSLTWSVSDTNVATINSDGMLSARSNGIVTVYATANDESEMKGRIDITVTNQHVPVIENESIASVSVYPNPAEGDILNINLKHSSIAEITLFDINGRIVVHQKMNQHTTQLDLSGIQAGIYLIRITGDEKTYTEKLIRK